jgi:hypothetical protein
MASMNVYELSSGCPPDRAASRKSSGNYREELAGTGLLPGG